MSYFSSLVKIKNTMAGKVAKSTTAENSRDSSGNPFLRNDKKIAANSPYLLLNKALLLMLLKKYNTKKTKHFLVPSPH